MSSFVFAVQPVQPQWMEQASSKHLLHQASRTSSPPTCGMPPGPRRRLRRRAGSQCDAVSVARRPEDGRGRRSAGGPGRRTTQRRPPLPHASRRSAERPNLILTDTPYPDLRLTLRSWPGGSRSSRHTCPCRGRVRRPGHRRCRRLHMWIRSRSKSRSPLRASWPTEC